MFDIKALAKNIKTRQISASKVVIETSEGKLIFDNPIVVEAEFANQRVFQVIGEPKLEKKLSEEDLKIIIERTGATKEEAEEALRKTGDVLEAIEYIMEKKEK